MWKSFLIGQNRSSNQSLKKSSCRQKHQFGHFWRLIMFFCAFSKILTKITFVRLMFLKLKQKKNMKNILLKVFISKLKNGLFRGSNYFFLSFHFFSFCFINNRHTNVILISIFENSQKTIIGFPFFIEFSF